MIVVETIYNVLPPATLLNWMTVQKWFYAETLPHCVCMLAQICWEPTVASDECISWKLAVE